MGYACYIHIHIWYIVSREFGPDLFRYMCEVLLIMPIHMVCFLGLFCVLTSYILDVTQKCRIGILD